MQEDAGENCVSRGMGGGGREKCIYNFRRITLNGRGNLENKGIDER